MNMNEYDFTLKFSLPSEMMVDDAILDKLFEAGCDDAMIGVGMPGCLSLDFTRKAKSASAAVFSAIKNVKAAVPGINLIEAAPDLVGLTDMAEILGCTRQNMRKIMLKENMHSLIPVHSGNPSLWHLSSVLKSFIKIEKYNNFSTLQELAATNMTINHVKNLKEISPEVEIEAKKIMTG